MDPSLKARRIIIERLKLEAGFRAPSEEEIKTYFQKFGTIVVISADEDKLSGFMEFSNIVEAERALAQPIHNVRGCNVRVFAAGTANLPK